MMFPDTFGNWIRTGTIGSFHWTRDRYTYGLARVWLPREGVMGWQIWCGSLRWVVTVPYLASVTQSGLVDWLTEGTVWLQLSTTVRLVQDQQQAG